MILSVLGGFGAMRVFNYVMAQMVGHSQDVRTEFANIKNAIMEMGAELAKQFGPTLAESLNQMSEWLGKSTEARAAMEGLGIFLTELVVPAVKAVAKYFEIAWGFYSKIIEFFSGTTAESMRLSAGVDMSEIEAIANRRKEIAAEMGTTDTTAAAIATPGAQSVETFGVGDVSNRSPLAQITTILRSIANRVEIPQ